MVDQSAGERELTQILSDLRRGVPGASERLLPIVYTELRGIAGRVFAAYKVDDIAVQPTMLVHDVFLKLTAKTEINWESRFHFYAVAANATRQLLVDHVRTRNADKRGGNWRRVTLASIEENQEVNPAIDLLDLEDAIHELGTIAPRQEQIVVMRFFGGLTVEEIASVLSVSPRTIQYDWRMARSWLRTRLDATMK